MVKSVVESVDSASNRVLGAISSRRSAVDSEIVICGRI